jgi:predicted RNA-binding Zn-ribbon protein involved in translation (DUF1610 family)
VLYCIGEQLILYVEIDMSRIMVYTGTIVFDCPECGKRNETKDSRPLKCIHCNADLYDYKYTKVGD